MPDPRECDVKGCGHEAEERPNADGERLCMDHMAEYKIALDLVDNEFDEPGFPDHEFMRLARAH